MPDGDLILYTTDDGAAKIQLRAMDGTVWLTQAEIARLFDTTKQNVSKHINRILDEGELQPDSVVNQSLTTATDGKNYRTNIYNLDAILAVGCRVRPILMDAGSVSKEQMEREVHARYIKFDEKRRLDEKKLAELEHDREVEEELKKLEREAAKKLPSPKTGG